MSRRKCFYGCKGKVSLFTFPKEESTRHQWIEFLFSDQPLPSATVLLCSRHFTEDSFLNTAQYVAGYSAKLILKVGAVPTVKGRVEDSEAQTGTAGSFCRILPDVRHAASQTDPQEGISVSTQPSMETPTDPPGKRSVGTQLSMKTLQNRFRSTATQARVPSRDCGVCTLTFPLDSPLLFLQPTIVKRPSKRPRLSLSDEEEGPCSPYMVVQVPDDST